MSQRIALLAGVSSFQSGLSALKTPPMDVRVLGELLRDVQIGGFDEVIELINPSEAALRRAIAVLFAKRKRDDLLVLYYSGHGILDDRGQLHLTATDTDVEFVSATAVASSYVAAEMDRSRSKRQVLVLDCCHSGAFGRGEKGAPPSQALAAQAFKGNGFGRVVLTASDATEFAWEADAAVPSENSIFTHFLAEGLRGAADTDHDGNITLDELYDYAYERIIDRAPKQTPGKWSFGQQGELWIAQRRDTHPDVQIRASALTPQAEPGVEEAPQQVVVSAPEEDDDEKEEAAKDAELTPPPSIPVREPYALGKWLRTFTPALLPAVIALIAQLPSWFNDTTKNAQINSVPPLPVPPVQTASVEPQAASNEQDAEHNGYTLVAQQVKQWVNGGCDNVLMPPTTVTGGKDLFAKLFKDSRCLRIVAASGAPERKLTLTGRAPDGDEMKMPEPANLVHVQHCARVNGEHRFSVQPPTADFFSVGAVDCPRPRRGTKSRSADYDLGY